MIIKKSAIQNHTAKKITSGSKPAHKAPIKLRASPKNQIVMNPMAIPSADFILHCSMSWGISKTIQHARLMLELFEWIKGNFQDIRGGTHEPRHVRPPRGDRVGEGHHLGVAKHGGGKDALIFVFRDIEPVELQQFESLDLANNDKES